MVPAGRGKGRTGGTDEAPMTVVRFWKGRRRLLSYSVVAFAVAFSLFGAGREFTPYDSVKAILPADLRISDGAQWLAWCQRQDKAIRARLDQGDLDSLANLLLLGA